MSATLAVIGLIVVLLLGLGVGYFTRVRQVTSRIKSVEIFSQKMVDDARYESEALKKEALIKAKGQLHQIKLDFDKEIEERKLQIKQLEKKLNQKEEEQEKKIQQFKLKEQEILQREDLVTSQEKEILFQKEEYDKVLADQKQTLEHIAGMTEKEALEQLTNSLEDEARHKAIKTLNRIERETKEQSQKKAQEILALACKRYAGDYVTENTVSVVNLPNEEMKGRIIGREGRNIRAIEAATGVDLIIDDTPEAVILSGFNLMRREIARLSLEKLILDGRIHPARIEGVVKKISTEVENSVKEMGERATFDVGVHGINSDLVKLLGRLRYRSSYTQNCLQHSMEVSFLCGMMASELGLNTNHARRAGLLHDIGKAVDHEFEGPHAVIGADLAKRYGEKSNIVQSIRAHHEDIAPENILDILVQAADALSGARPGARREMLESYVKRLEDLERIANTMDGVTKSYAIQAGRELRIVLESEITTDDQAFMLAYDVARKIEENLVYPGQIRVTVIRETRAVDYAK